MEILAHRGYWKNTEEKNTLMAFKRAFENGFGIETDVRDYQGELVVSHNVADEKCPLFEKVLQIYNESNCQAFLAINIKADGVQELLMKLLNEYGVKNYFVFDMSVPEQVVYRTKKMNYFTRLSEYETEPVLLQDAMGLWMDEWESSWINADVVKKYLDMGKYVSIISPEIHGRDSSFLWAELEKIDSKKLFLCTDLPHKAKSER